MRYRNGFVSNSSSSSFIISKKDEGPLKIMVEMDLSNCIDLQIKTKEELDAYILDEYSWEGDSLSEIFKENPWAEEQYNNMLKVLENGEIIYKLSGSSEDYDGPGSYLYNSGLKGLKDINIIYTEE